MRDKHFGGVLWIALVLPSTACRVDEPTHGDAGAALERCFARACEAELQRLFPNSLVVNLSPEDRDLRFEIISAKIVVRTLEAVPMIATLPVADRLASLRWENDSFVWNLCAARILAAGGATREEILHALSSHESTVSGLVEGGDLDAAIAEGARIGALGNLHMCGGS